MSAERDVLERLRSGDRKGAAILVLKELGPNVLGWLRGTLAKRDADDAFTRFADLLWRDLPSFRREDRLEAWVWRVAFEAARDVERERERRDGEQKERWRRAHAAALAAALLATPLDAHGGPASRRGPRELRRRLGTSVREGWSSMLERFRSATDGGLGALLGTLDAAVRQGWTTALASFSAPRLERKMRAIVLDFHASLSDGDRLLLELLSRKLGWNDIAEALSGGAGTLDAAAVKRRHDELEERLAERLRRAGLVE